VTEESPFDPQTDYAVCKMLDERELSDLADDRFSPTFLRNATAYGASPRMRFDLVVNNLSALAWTTQRIAMVSDGTPWRPIVHILDISRAFLAALAAPREAVHDQVFNVGRTDENYQIREIATCVGEVFPDCEVTFGKSDPDQRSYRVSFDKITTACRGLRAIGTCGPEPRSCGRSTSRRRCRRPTSSTGPSRASSSCATCWPRAASTRSSTGSTTTRFANTFGVRAPSTLTACHSDRSRTLQRRRRHHEAPAPGPDVRHLGHHFVAQVPRQDEQIVGPGVGDARGRHHRNAAARQAQALLVGLLSTQ
jgi:hypothetical protein